MACSSCSTLSPPMAPMPWDRDGLHAVRDLQHCKNCPLDVLAHTKPGKGTLSEQLNMLYDELLDIVTFEGEVGQRQLKAARHANAYVAQHKAKVSCADLDSKIESIKGEEDKVIMSKLFQLADAYSVLSRNKYIRRWHATTRLLDRSNEGVQGCIKTPPLTQLYYILFPCLMFFCCFTFQSLMLHLATHFYVYYVDSELGSFVSEKHVRLFDLVGNYVGFSTGHEQDGAVIPGSYQIPLFLLDLTGVLPAVLWALASANAWFRGKFEIGLWNKTLIVGSCMAVLKGIFDVVTIMPDSTGWDNCKARLGEESLEHFRKLRFTRELWPSFFRLLSLEVFGSRGRRIRYCADMMISGHTYFAALFSLSAYRQMCYSGLSRLSTRLLGFVLLLCLCTEVFLVAAARFHYTVDMLAALVLVVLLFDSTYVEQVASDWSEGFMWRDPVRFEPKSSPLFRMCLRWGRRCDGRCISRGGSGSSDEPLVIPSRCRNLANLRVLSGAPPWDWHHAEGEAEEEEDLCSQRLIYEELTWESESGGSMSSPGSRRSRGPQPWAREGAEYSLCGNHSDDGD